MLHRATSQQMNVGRQYTHWWTLGKTAHLQDQASGDDLLTETQSKEKINMSKRKKRNQLYKEGEAGIQVVVNEDHKLSMQLHFHDFS